MNFCTIIAFKIAFIHKAFTLINEINALMSS